MFPKIFRVFEAISTALQSPLLLLIRLYWGWQFAQTGWGKLQNLPGTAEYFASLGLPLPMVSAGSAAVVEAVGGLLLVLGAFSRFASLALFVTMAVAYVTAEAEALQAIITAPDQFTAATPFLFAFASLLVFVFGPGRWSVDAQLHSTPRVSRP